MNISLEQVERLLQGAESVLHKADGIVPMRFTEAELRAFDGNADFQRKTRASSCVRLAFVTDAKGFGMSYHVAKGSSRKFYYFDICVNGVMVSHTGHESHDECPDGSFHVALDGRRNAVTVYFPCLSEITIKSFEADDATELSPDSRSKVLYSYGDSITQGYDARHPSLAYPSQLADALGAQVFSKAIGGDIFNPALVTEVGPNRPDFITVAYGTNDWSHGEPKEKFLTNMNGFFANLHRLYANVPTFVILPLWRRDRDRVTPVGTFDELRAYLTEGCKPYDNCLLLDGYQMTPHLEEIFSDAYLHPNDFGFQYYGKNLICDVLARLQA